MSRAFLVVLDSVGCGGAPDAGEFGDAGANTLAHIAQFCATNRPEGPVRLPNLDNLGLGAAVRLASDAAAPGLEADPAGRWGAATEVSRGKDTPSGHWELAGLPVPWDWHYFPETDPCFSPELVAKVCAAAGTEGILGNRHASGTLIIEEEAEAHLRTGWPICYTSVDSVFQIAAHEEAFGLQRLLDLCAALALRGGRRHLDADGEPKGFRHRAARADALRRGAGRGRARACHRQDRRYLLDAGHRQRGEGFGRGVDGAPGAGG